MIVKNVETKETKGQNGGDTKIVLLGILAGLGITFVTCFILVFWIWTFEPGRWGHATDVVSWIYAAKRAPIAGVIGGIVVAWLLGKREAEKDSS